MNEFKLITHSQTECGKKRISSRKEDGSTKGMLKVEAGTEKQREDLSSALLGSPQMPLDSRDHMPPQACGGGLTTV